jgi:hypothetical protein
MLRAFVSELRSLTGAVKEVDKELVEIYESHPDHDLFASLPGSGAALGPRLIAAIGTDRERFDSAGGT